MENQQKFLITLSGDKVSAKSAGGFYSKVDSGIVKKHFEIGAGESNFIWAYPSFIECPNSFYYPQKQNKFRQS